MSQAESCDPANQNVHDLLLAQSTASTVGAVPLLSQEDTRDWEGGGDSPQTPLRIRMSVESDRPPPPPSLFCTGCCIDPHSSMIELHASATDSHPALAVPT